MRYLLFASALIIGLSLSSCRDDFDTVTEETGNNGGGNNGDNNNGGDNNGINAIAALPDEMNYPTNNQFSTAKQELGRTLFWDPILSGELDVSCGSCHHPDFGYADGLERSRGVGAVGLGVNRTGGVLIDRNAPTIINVGFNGIEQDANFNPLTAPMFWDNRATSLEGQALEPILSAIEMRGNDIPENQILDIVVQRLEAIPAYRDQFESAFGTNAITLNRISQALATFQRSIVSTESRFDQFMRGNNNALSQRELDGLNSFIQAGCADCHSGAMLSDFELHTLSVPNNGVNDSGATGNFDFRTPTLRNVALTAPYMHNGEFQTLDQVLDFYNDISRGNGNSQNNNVNDNEIAADARNLNLNNRDIDDIVAFLGTLTDENFDTRIPTSVPSNLPVGGRIGI